MKNNNGQVNCAEFQEQLAELLASGADLSHHPHLQSCQLCSALLADLETIASAARQLFPSVEPPDNLWEQIESAIQQDDEAPVPQDGKA